MEVSSTAKGREVIDPGLPDVLEVLMIQTYRSAVSDNGAVDLTKIKTVAEIKQFRLTPNGRRTLGIDVENHHLLTEYWAKVLYRKVHNSDPPAGWVDEMPGLLMDIRNHRIGTDEIPSFHQILDDVLPREVSGIVTRDHIIDKIEEAYEQWDPELGPVISQVIRQWIEENGL